MNKTIFGAIIGSILMLLSCNKIEGQGGTSSIIGQLKVINVNNTGEIIAEYDGADEDIYIIYGAENTTYDDKMVTSYDGSFEFNYLVPGEYQIFAYSECDSCASGQDVKIINATISSKKEVVHIGEIIIYD